MSRQSEKSLTTFPEYSDISSAFGFISQGLTSIRSESENERESMTIFAPFSFREAKNTLISVISIPLGTLPVKVTTVSLSATIFEDISSRIELSSEKPVKLILVSPLSVCTVRFSLILPFFLIPI